MNWNYLPNDIIKYILLYRKQLTMSLKAFYIISNRWKTYRTRVLYGRFKMLRYLKDFRIWNPTIQEFLLCSRL